MQSSAPQSTDIIRTPNPPLDLAYIIALSDLPCTHSFRHLTMSLKDFTRQDPALTSSEELHDEKSFGLSQQVVGKNEQPQS